MRILMVAADAMEFTGIVSHLTGVQTAALPVDWGRRGQLGEHETMLVANGAGASRAAAGTVAALKHFEAEAVISTGFCGALEPELGIGDIVCASSVNGRYAARLPAQAAAHRQGMVMSIDRVARTSEEKRVLRERGGTAVEMESAGVAREAQERGLSFYCIRTISDLSGEDLANDFNAALREDGHFATMKVLTGALRRPLVCLPELIRLRNRCAKAARSLGDFIADCRF